jgi:uncharacterized RDD family membrane protein YckC
MDDAPKVPTTRRRRQKRTAPDDEGATLAPKRRRGTAAINPYAPPVEVEDVESDEDGVSHAPLATLGSRLLARLVDGVLGAAGIIVGAVAYATFGDAEGLEDPGNFLVLLLPAVPVYAYQWWLVSKTGQTLGKKWLGIRVVRYDQGPVNFISAVLLREWTVMGAGMIPFIGSFIGLLDIVLIFGTTRRCLHDRIAGTIVVMAGR